MKLSSRKTIFFLCAVCATTAITLPAHASCSAAAPCFKTLVSFDGTNGAYPSGDSDQDEASLVQGTSGNFYGTTTAGGPNCSPRCNEGAGTVFEITPAGKLTELYSFCSKSGCTDGAQPLAGLVLATNGNFYGTTEGYNFGTDGTIFEITAAGKLTTLQNLDYTDGAYPKAGLVQATNGDLYGTTYEGGAHGYGTVFELTPAGKLTTLYSFCSITNCDDGAHPFAGLVQAINGNFYGTTWAGGAHGYGTVFELTPAGKLTTLYSFCSKSG
jgi:uncharacterized repeat protein (TIGR03803 family)